MDDKKNSEISTVVGEFSSDETIEVSSENGRNISTDGRRTEKVSTVVRGCFKKIPNSFSRTLFRCKVYQNNSPPFVNSVV